MMDFLMTATPAWPPQSAPRLHVETQLGEGVSVPVDGNPAHYLISVMRVKADDIVLLFDGRSGEWAAKARDIRKRERVLEGDRERKSGVWGERGSERVDLGGRRFIKQKKSK